MYNTKKHCTCCLSNDLKHIISFGNVPLAGSYVKDVDDTVTFPLSLSLCSNCYHVQVNEYVDKEYLFKDYRYMSNYSMKDHFKSFADVIDQRFGNDLNVLEIGSNDGTFIDILQKKGNNLLGVEPATNISEKSISKGHVVINDFFSKRTLINNNIKPSSIDIVTASNCFAHIEDIDVILEGVNYVLAENGTFIVEVHYGPNMFQSVQYDFIYHEHMYYYSLASLNALMLRNGFHIVDVEFIETHGGSIRVFVAKDKRDNTPFVNAMKTEEEAGYHSSSMYMEFAKKVEIHLADTFSLFQKLSKEGKTIVGYGASGRANAFLNYANIDHTLIDFIIDDSPERSGRYIPKQNIPIKPLNHALGKKIDVLFVTAWNFVDQIRNRAKPLDYKEELVVFPTVNFRAKNETSTIG